jgi:Xaa-Pro aminopeptidase
MNFRARQEKFAKTLIDERLNYFAVTHLPNVRYLCGFTGSAGVLAFSRQQTGRWKLALFTDGRYTQQAREQSVGAKVVTAKGPAVIAAAEWMFSSARKPTAVGFEAEHLSVAASRALSRAVSKLRLKPTSSLIENIRMIKDVDEVAQIRAAVNLASSVFDAVLGDIKPGVPENRIAAEIEYLSRRMGAEGMSFDTLVAAGKRSALPHGVASSNPLPASGFVILDFGVILAGYCSDMTRTVHIGQPDEASRKMYAAVLKAQLAGIEAVAAGVKTEEVDSAARKVLHKSGFGRYFTHSTGHGVGLEIHEPPGLRKAAVPTNAAKKTARKPGQVLEAGMVITIEPGVYIPGVGGVRIEDMVLVTEHGCDILTPTKKELIAI